MRNIEDEDADPVGQAPRDPLKVFKGLAVKHGLMKEGDQLDQKLFDLCTDVVGLCAAIGDQYGDGEAGGNAGEHIRAEYWEP